MNSTIKQYQILITEILNKDPFFAEHGVVWLTEDLLDISFEVNKSLNSTGICAVVTTPKLEYQGINHNGDMQFDTTVQLQLIENVTVNRGRSNNDNQTALDFAHHALYTLCGYKTGNFNNFTPVSVEQQTVAGTAQNKLLQVTAEVKSTVTL